MNREYVTPDITALSVSQERIADDSISANYDPGTNDNLWTEKYY